MLGYFSPQALDLVVDVPGLHRTAARAVDAQDHALRALVLERFLQTGDDVVGARGTFGTDHAPQLHERSVFAGGCHIFLADPAHPDEQQREEVDKKQKLEEDAPVAGAPLLLYRRERHLLERIALPAITVNWIEIAIGHRCT